MVNTGAKNKAIEFEVTEEMCWECTSHKPGKKGYTNFSMDMGQYRLHRVMYEAFIGEIPDGMILCHSCDNVRCINPQHLFIGSNKDNSLDMVLKGRQAKGERNGAAKLTEDQVRYVLQSNKGPSVIRKELNVSKSTILSIRSGRTWKHLSVSQ